MMPWLMRFSRAALRPWTAALEPPPLPTWLAVGAPAHLTQIGTVTVLAIDAATHTADVQTARGQPWTVSIASLHPLAAAAMVDWLRARRIRQRRDLAPSAIRAELARATGTAAWPQAEVIPFNPNRPAASTRPAQPA